VAGRALPLAVRDRKKDHRCRWSGPLFFQAETKPIGKPPVIAGICCGLRVDGWQPMPWDELNRKRCAIYMRIPVMAIGYSSRRRSLIPVIAIMAGRQSKAGHDGSAARRRWRKQRLQD
jgi:hypothetical protein